MHNPSKKFHQNPFTTFSVIRPTDNSDFGLLDPDGYPDRHQNLSPWTLGHALPLQKISSKSVHNFSVIRRTDKQTNKQTDKQTEVKTSPASSAEVKNRPELLLSRE